MARSKLFTDPVELQKKIDSYFEFKKTDFDYKFDVVKSGIEAGKELQIKVQRPVFIHDFCVYCGILVGQFNYYKKQYEEKKDSIIEKIDNSEELTANEQCLVLLARVYDKISGEIITAGLTNRVDPGLAKVLTGLQDTVNIQQNISINALPVTISNNIIDLTDAEFTVLDKE